MLLQYASERKRLYKFMIVGAMGALVDFSVFNVLRQGLHWSPLWSSVVSFLSAATHNFVWHRYWTYPDSRSKAVWLQWGQFVTLNAVGLAIRTPLFLFFRPWTILLMSYMPAFLLFLPPQILGENLALGLVMGIVLFWNFFSNRYLTYNDVVIGATSPISTQERSDES